MKKTTVWSKVICSMLICFHANVLFAEMQYAVEARNAPVVDLIRMFAQMEGKNVIFPNAVEGAVTARFPSVSLGDALDSILDANHLSSTSSNNVIRISPTKDLEQSGRDLVTRTVRLNYAKSKVVSEQVKALLSSRGSLAIDERSNTLTIRDTPTSQMGVDTLIKNIDNLDKQVLIEAKIVEVSSGLARELGVQWGVTGSAGPFRVSGPSLPPSSSATPSTPVIGAPATPATGTPTPAATGPNFIQNTPTPTNPLAGILMSMGPFGNTTIDVQLTAAERNGEAEILSRPSIVTMNNQPATIQSGLKVYVKTAGSLSINSTSGSLDPSSNLQQIDTGITLVATPQITPDNKISLTIDVTSSQIDPANGVDGVPAVASNSARTTALLQDGQTTVIGGLTQTTKSKQKDGIPYLSTIPILGRLFGLTASKQTKKELLIFLTPTVVKDGEKIQLGLKEDNKPEK